eukprot:TRINITY_DN16597_c0_g1_i1.p1 TRINITY_DN16597_c0_g1~~TRINITY_DN16597_c0_g1_i1.p1  ORF type:complete len:671 (+),score=265.87 TRINITY_DN16597_c0_g1_i1:103-2115(+)
MLHRGAPCALRWVSTRCMDYMEPWVWQPHTQDPGYFAALSERGLVDPVTGTQVKVVGVHEFSAESAADVQEYLAALRAGPRGRRAGVVLNWSSAEMLTAVGEAHAARSEEGRSAAVDKCAALGYPPDLLAEGLANQHAYDVAPWQASQAAAAAALSLGLKAHYLGQPPALMFQRMQYINQMAAAFQAEEDGGADAVAQLTLNPMGLHPSHEAHLYSRALAEKLISRPDPSVVEHRLTSMPVPALFFRCVQPVVHLVLEVKRLLPTLPFNDGTVAVVLDASLAPMFYKVFKDEGLAEVDACGVYHEFKAVPDARDEVPEASNQMETARRLEEIDDREDGALPPGQRQAEFEVQLLLFLHLARLRPDVLRMKQAVANTYLVNGLVLDALMYLRSMVDAQVPGSQHVLSSMIDDMVREGMVDADDDLVHYCMAPPAAGEPGDAAAGDGQGPAAAPLLLEATVYPDAPRGKMVYHNQAGRVVATDDTTAPDLTNLNAGEMSSEKQAFLNNALMMQDEHDIAKHTPPVAVQKRVEKRSRDAFALHFEQPRHHPMSEAYKASPNATLPSEGQVFALQRRRPNDMFPEPPPEKNALAEHANAANKALGRIWDTDSPMDRLLKDAVKVRTTSPPRTPHDKDILRSKREDREKVKQYRQKVRNNEQWAKWWGGRDSFQS